MAVDKRKALEPYEGERVSVVGYFSASGVAKQPHVKTACVEDCEVTTPDGKTFHIEHTWVQRANVIVNQKPLKGSKVTFTAVVTPYQRRLSATNEQGLMRETAWGLRNPEDVEVTSTDELDYPEPLFPKAYCRTTSPEPAPATPPAAPASSPVQVAQAVKELTGRVDVETLRKAVPHLAQIGAALTLAGGEQDFLTLLELLRG